MSAPNSIAPGLDAASPVAQRRRRIFLGLSAAVAVGVLYAFREVLLPFALGAILAYVFAPAVRSMEQLRIGGRPMPRWAAVLSLYLVLLGTLTASGVFAVPRLIAELQRLTRDAPQMVATVRDQWIPRAEDKLRAAMDSYNVGPGAETEGTSRGGDTDRALRIVPVDGGFEVRLPEDGLVVTPHERGYRVHFPEPRKRELDLTDAITAMVSRTVQSGETHASTFLGAATAIVKSVIAGIFTFSITLMLSAFMLLTSDRIFGFFRTLVQPARRAQFDGLLARIDRGLSGVVRGQLLICVVNGILSGIGFWYLELDYWPILTIIATVFSIVPIFGAILSSIPAVVMGLKDSAMTGVLVLAWIVVIHQLEANLLNPKIMGDAAKVHPVLIVFALLAGERFYGIAGALLAVPVLSIAQSVFLHYRATTLGVATSSASIPPVDPPPRPESG